MVHGKGVLFSIGEGEGTSLKRVWTPRRNPCSEYVRRISSPARTEQWRKHIPDKIQAGRRFCSCLWQKRKVTHWEVVHFS